MSENPTVLEVLDDEIPETQPNPDGFFADTKTQEACSVRVALRVRPLINKELFEKQIVRAYQENNTVQIGPDKTFTYDACFAQECKQEDIFLKCVKNLVLGCFLGYNATVLAYGQTGSGKTWTMGSGYTIGLTEDEHGIIPRVIRLIFDEVEKRKSKTEFIVKCSFLEIYNEELHDLLDPRGQPGANQKINIREEKNGQISVYGLTEEKVENANEMADLLDKGSNVRTTASTLMNSNSSRSHAIFTITIEQHQIDDLFQAGVENLGGQNQGASDEFMTAKFHFVDLAGSERAKKTGAVGATLKEGININKSLLALGNVISNLSDGSSFIPYRDSKLTRILQDSLGGNSRTSMIACVSPAESNFDETLNSLNYASRARKIQNKPKVNRDPNSALIAELRQQVYEFQKECLKYRGLLQVNQIEFESTLELPSEEEMAQKEKNETTTMASSRAGGPSEFAMSGKEIRALEDQIKQLKIENSQKDKENQSLKALNTGISEQLKASQIECYSVQQQSDQVRLQLDQVNVALEALNLKDQVYSNIDNNDSEQATLLLDEYQNQIKQLREELDQKQLLLTQLQNDSEFLVKQNESEQKIMEKQSQEIEKLKRNTAKLQKENINMQTELRNAQKNRGGVTNVKRSASNGPKQKNDFQHSFRKSTTTLAERQENAQAKLATIMETELEQNLEKFNQRFMETLTQSLTQQLGLDIKAAEDKRRRTMATSIIETGTGGSFIGLGRKNSGQRVGRDTVPRKEAAFGQGGNFGSLRNKMAASMIVQDNTVTNRLSDKLPDQLSMIQDAETVEEADTIQVSDEKDEENEDEIAESFIKGSVLSNKDQQQLLKDSIAKRASLLASLKETDNQPAEEEAPVTTQEDVEMKNDESFEEVAIEDCSEEEKEVYVEPEELFDNLQKINEDEEQNVRMHHESVLVNLDGAINEKEAILNAIKQSQNEMQANLVHLMKEKYHHQVLELTKEITALEHEKRENLSNGTGISQQQKKKIELEFMSKQKELERQLKDAKDKNKHQLAVKKQVDQQNSKIKGLETEIQKIKIQKISAQRKFKEQSEKYNILRKQKADEILRIKKQNLKKDKEIDQLRKDAKRKDILALRRKEEIKVLQTQKNLKLDKKKNASNMRKQKEQIDVELIKNWIRISVDKMIELKDAEREIKNQNEQLEEVQAEIEDESNHKGSLQLLKEKLLVKKYLYEGQPEEQQDAGMMIEIEQEMEKLELEIQSYQENINNLTEKQDYINTKISEISKEIVQVNIDFSGSLQKQNLSSAEGIKALIDSFFSILQEVCVQLTELQGDHSKQLQELDQIKDDYQNQLNICEAQEKYFQAKMQGIEEEYHQKEVLLTQLIEESRMDGEQYQDVDGMMGGHSSSGQIVKQQRMMTAKEEIQKSKEQAMHETKMFLSKRIAELEKTNHILENENTKVSNQLNQALGDKEQQKMQISQLKNQLKMTNEMSSNINLRAAIKQEVSLGNQQVNFQNSLGNNKQKRVYSLADRRIELKNRKNLKKQGSNHNGHVNQETLETEENDHPRVIAFSDNSHSDGDEEEQKSLEVSQEHLRLPKNQFSQKKHSLQLNTHDSERYNTPSKHDEILDRPSSKLQEARNQRYTPRGLIQKSQSTSTGIGVKKTNDVFTRLQQKTDGEVKRHKFNNK